MVEGGKVTTSALDQIDGSQKKVEAGSKSLASAQVALMSKMGGAAKSTKDAAAATDKVAASTNNASTAVSKASLAAGALAVAEQRLTIAARQLADAQTKSAAAANSDAAAQARAANAVTAAQTKFAAASLAVERQLARQTSAQNDNEKTSIRQQYAIRNVGQQFGDFGLQVAGGIDPARAFGQQAGQLGYALSEMGGKLGAVGRFLTGPWGIALTIASAVLAPFVEKLFQGGDAADGETKAFKSLADATKALDEATGRSNKSKAEEINLSATATRQFLKEALAKRQLLASRLEGFKAGIDAPIGGTVGGGVGFASATSAQITANSIAANEKAIANAQKALNGAGFVEILNKVTASTDKAAGATHRYTDAETRLRREFENSNGGPAAQRKLAEGLLAAQRARDAVTKSNTGGLSSVNTLGDAEARLAAATTARGKAEANLSLLRIRTAAQVKAGTLTEAERIEKLTAAEQAVTRAKDAEKALTKARVDGNKAARDIAQTEKEYGAILDALVAKYQPAIAAAQKYLATQEDIADLLKRGDIDIGQAVTFSLGADTDKKAADAKAANDAAAKVWPNAANDFADILDDASTKLGRKLKSDATEAGENFAGAAGQVANALRGIVGGQFGNALETLTNGGKSSILSSIFSGKSDPYGGYTPGQLRMMDTLPAGVGNRIGAGSKQADDLATGISKLAKGVGISDEGATKIGKFGGKAIEGAAQGALINSVFAPIAKGLGLKTSKTGAEIGGAIGSAIPIPGGQIIGSILGSVVGGLFKKAKTGGATITSTTGDATLSGNSAGLKANADNLAQSVQQGLSSIAQQLGGTVGSFGGITIGQYKDKFRVNTVGTRLGGKAGIPGLTSYTSADDAVAAAIKAAIARGAVQGLDAAVQKAINSSSDINVGVAEALKVQDVERLIGGTAGAIKKTFEDFAAQTKSRLDIAKRYGLDVVAVEKATAEQRAALVSDTLKQSVGSLQDFLDNLKYGDLAEGSASDQRTAILAKIASLQSKAQEGDQNSIDQISSLFPQLVSSSRDAFGTASAQYAADRELALTGAQKIIQMENDRITAASNAQQATTDAVNKVADNTNEANDLLAQQNALLRNIYAALGSEPNAANDYGSTAIYSTMLRA